MLPAMGVTSDVLSTFSRKPIFGYRAMAYSMISIAFLSWIVYGHHMFISGMNPALGTSFMLTTMVIAVPSAIKSFNWLGTLWGGSIRFTTPMIHAISFLSTFTIGGLSGIFMANTPVDIFIHDTYFIVAHFHYVVAGIIFAMFAAITYWYPKLFGRMMNETGGRIHAVLTFVFFNLVFFPMHFLGMGGMMRRIYNPTQYEFLQTWQPMAVFMTWSAFILGAVQILFIWNFVASLVKGRKAALNPWHANTLEWAAPSPPPHGNWGATVPTVYRGPYEYSVPGMTEDYLPQTQVVTGARPAARALSARTEGRETGEDGRRLAAPAGVRDGGRDRRPDRGRRPRHQHRRRAGRARLAHDLRAQSLPLPLVGDGRGACSSSTATGSWARGSGRSRLRSPWRSALGDPRRWVRGLGLLAVLLVSVQGLIGGLRVVLLQDALAIVHGCLAQLFFALLVGIAVVTGREVADAGRRAGGRPPALPLGPCGGRWSTGRSSWAPSPRTRTALWWHVAGAAVTTVVLVGVALPCSGARGRTRCWSGGHGP